MHYAGSLTWMYWMSSSRDLCSLHIAISSTDRLYVEQMLCVLHHKNVLQPVSSCIPSSEQVKTSYVRMSKRLTYVQYVVTMTMTDQSI